MVDNWNIIISQIAEKKIAAIPNPDKRRILLAIDKQHNGLSGDIKPLQGRDEWRLRIGKWRILMSVDIEERFILIKYIDSRGDVYK